MTRLRSLLLCSGLGLGLLSASALAMPPVLERVPDNAMAAIAIPAPVQFEKNLNALTTAIDQPLPLPSFKDALGMAGFNSGVDETKSMAVVIMPPKEAKPGAKDAKGAEDDIDLELFGAEEDRMVFLIPVTSYADLLKNFAPDAKPAGEGKVDTIALPNGDDGFAKDIGGGYAVIGSNKEVVEAFTGKPGANPVRARMGKAGESLADASDLVTLFNVEAMRPMAEKAVKDMKKTAKDQLDGMGQDADAQMALVNWMSETVIRDTRFAVGGIKLSAGGVAMDMVGTFNDGSYLGKVFAAKGESSALLSKLPIGPYLAAFAMDTSNAAVKQFFKDMTSKTALPGGEAATKIAIASFEHAEGQSGVVGFPMGGALAGLLTATVGFTPSKDPAATMQNMKDGVLAMNGQTAGGMTYKANVAEPSGKAGESAFASWEIKMESDGSNQMATQGLAMIFGPQGGPAGYMAKTDAGVYRTYAKNSELMANALKVGKGVEPLNTDKLLLGTQEQLPKGRLAEAYLGTKSILDLVLPFAAMAGVPVAADKVPEKLPPVGMAISSDQGAGRMSIFVPSPVIKTGVALGESFAEMQNGGNNGGEDAPADKPKDSGTGQPRF